MSYDGLTAHEDHSSRYSSMAYVRVAQVPDGGSPDRPVVAVATNGKVAVVLALECQGEPPSADKPLFLPPDAFRGDGKGAIVTVNDEVCVQKLRGKTEVYDLPSESGRYPDIQGACPPGDAPYIAISLDAQSLMAIAKAISENSVVTLLIPPDEGMPVVVLGYRDDCWSDAFGVQMPLRIKHAETPNKAYRRLSDLLIYGR